MIIKSALLLIREQADGRSLLMVKEEDDTHWLLPGGRLMPHESVEAALGREIREELSTSVADVRPVGTVQGHTADGRPLTINLFLGSLTGDAVPDNEITDIRWIGRSDIPAIAPDLTPITVQKIFPFLSDHNLW